MAERLQQIELIGRGAMAEVYRGALVGARGTSRRVAIKRLRPDLKEDPHAVDLFVNEGRIVVQLSHENVVRGIEFDRDDDGYYLVFEWLDCCSLDALRDRIGPLHWNAVVAIGEKACDALSYIHSLHSDGDDSGIIHRDVTPNNVFITDRGEIKLADFGVAVGGDGAVVDATEVGTPGFAAPEQTTGNADQRSDVFGLGATLNALTTTVPSQIEAVFKRATAEPPDDRYADAASFKAALRSARRELVEQGDTGVDDDALKRLAKHVESSSIATPPCLDGAVQSILGGALDEPAVRSQPTPVRRRGPRRGFIVAAAVTLFVAGSWWLSGSPPFEDEPPSSVELASKALSAPPAKPPSADNTTPPRRPTALVTVNINSVPWARVKDGNRSLGNTPIRGVKLAVGRHRLMLIHPLAGKPHMFTIDVVESKSTQTFVFDLVKHTMRRRTGP